MTILEQVLRTLRSWSYQRDRRRRQKQRVKAMPEIAYRERQIAILRRGHRAGVNALYAANKADVLRALRGL